MSAPSRIVLPEILDGLDPEDPRASRSRRDLRRIHLAMRTLSILKRALRRLNLAAPPRRMIELGGGDGTLLLRLARELQPIWPKVTLTLLDLHDIVSPETRRSYEGLGWRLQVVRQDVLQWAIESPTQRYDVCIASLFLHHFDDVTLPRLLRGIAANCDAFVACEPRRAALAKLGSSLIGFLGTNKVTREDAVTSVAAGFTGRELTALWPRGDGEWNCGEWHCEEYGAWPFTHCFAASRGAKPRAVAR